MIHNLDLFLHHRHPAGEVVMFPDLSCQFLDFGLCNRLTRPYVIFRPTG